MVSETIPKFLLSKTEANMMTAIEDSNLMNTIEQLILASRFIYQQLFSILKKKTYIFANAGKKANFLFEPFSEIISKSQKNRLKKDFYGISNIYKFIKNSLTLFLFENLFYSLVEKFSFGNILFLFRQELQPDQNVEKIFYLKFFNFF